MESPLRFVLETTSSHGRAGEITTRHGRVLTPAFMPVATLGSVKTLDPQEVAAVGAQMILANAYHLYLQPGTVLVRELGGIHTFSGWSGPILTDSGGFQAFSLGGKSKINTEGILFRSHIDGTEHLFTPETAMQYQSNLGSDIAMCLDQCIGYGEPQDSVRLAMDRTHLWATRCKDAYEVGKSADRQAIFGIVQGGTYTDLRTQSAEYIASLGFDGYAVGGLGVGEPKQIMYDLAGHVGNLLPVDQPRYLMGVGSPEDLIEGVARGMDMFDCALPTRVARNGALFTRTGRVDITKQRFKDVPGPLQEDCDCYTCARFSTAYLHHLFKAKELLGPRLASVHNLRFVLRLMQDIRKAIMDGSFQSFKDAFLREYVPTDESARLAQKEASMIARVMRR